MDTFMTCMLSACCCCHACPRSAVEFAFTFGIAAIVAIASLPFMSFLIYVWRLLRWCRCCNLFVDGVVLVVLILALAIVVCVVDCCGSLVVGC